MAIVNRETAITAIREGKYARAVSNGAFFKMTPDGVFYFGKKRRTWRPAGTNNRIFKETESFEIFEPEIQSPTPVETVRKVNADTPTV